MAQLPDLVQQLASLSGDSCWFGAANETTKCLHFVMNERRSVAMSTAFTNGKGFSRCPAVGVYE